MTLKELRKELRTLFKEHNIESPETDSGLLLMHVLHLNKTQLLLDNPEISPEAYAQILELANRRLQGEPVRYLTGVCPFMDLEFYVNPATLIPRPDTEVLICTVSDYIARQARPLTLWDIGCGSGCIGITLASMHKDLTVMEIDISPMALETAKRTAKRYGLDDRIQFIHQDILKGMPEGEPDIIVSNPPYIPTKDIDALQTEVKHFEPRSALDGGVDGLLFYRHIIRHAPLAKKGLLAFEIGYDQGESVPSLMKADGYTDVTLQKDFAGNPRVVFGHCNK